MTDQVNELLRLIRLKREELAAGVPEDYRYPEEKMSPLFDAFEELLRLLPGPGDDDICGACDKVAYELSVALRAGIRELT